MKTSFSFTTNAETDGGTESTIYIHHVPEGAAQHVSLKLIGQFVEDPKKAEVHLFDFVASNQDGQAFSCGGSAALHRCVGTLEHFEEPEVSNVTYAVLATDPIIVETTPGSSVVRFAIAPLAGKIAWSATIDVD